MDRFEKLLQDVASGAECRLSGFGAEFNDALIELCEVNAWSGCGGFYLALAEFVESWDDGGLAMAMPTQGQLDSGA